MIGGMSWPPSEAAVSIDAALERGMPARINAGMVADPVVTALAAPLPLTEATPNEPMTAVCGNA